MLMHDARQFDTAAAQPAGSPAAPDTPAALRYGLSPATLIETAHGWRPAGRLTPGTIVMTLDGPAPLAGLELTAMGAGRVVRVAGGAFHNCAAIDLLPDQPVFVESRLAGRRHGSDWVALRAEALCALPRIALRDRDAVTLATLSFSDPQVVFAGGDLPVLCPAIRAGAPALCAEAPTGAVRPMLGDAAARRLLNDRARIIAASGGCA